MSATVQGRFLRAAVRRSALLLSWPVRRRARPGCPATVRGAGGVLLSGVLLLCACDRSAVDVQGRQLLDGVLALDADAVPERHLAQLRRIQELQLTVPSLIGLRDACVSAHLSLQEARSEQAKARSLMSAGAAGARLTPARSQALADMLARSEALVEQGRRAASRCRAGSLALAKQTGR